MSKTKPTHVRFGFTCSIPMNGRRNVIRQLVSCNMFHGTSLPEDMSTTSRVGGGFIAGDALAALTIGVYGSLRSML